jgi:hypothetical protein
VSLCVFKAPLHAAIIKALIERDKDYFIQEDRVHFNGKFGRSIATQHGSTNSV